MQQRIRKETTAAASNKHAWRQDQPAGNHYQNNRATVAESFADVTTRTIATTTAPGGRKYQTWSKKKKKKTEGAKTHVGKKYRQLNSTTRFENRNKRRDNDNTPAAATGDGEGRHSRNRSKHSGLKGRGTEGGRWEGKGKGEYVCS